MVIIIIPCVIFIIKIKMWKGRGGEQEGRDGAKHNVRLYKRKFQRGFNSPLEYLPLCTPC